MFNVVRQLNSLCQTCNQTEVLQRSLVKFRLQVEDAVAAHKHGKHEYPQVVVLFFINVAKTLGVHEENVNSRAILLLDRSWLVPNPETLRGRVYFVAHLEATRLTDKVV